MRPAHQVQEFQFRIVHSQPSMVVIMIRPIKQPAPNTGKAFAKTRMARRAIVPMKAKVQQVDPQMGREEAYRHGKGRQFHNGIFHQTVFPRSSSDQTGGRSMVLAVVVVQHRMVEGVVDGKRPNLPQDVSGNQFSTGLYQRVGRTCR